MARIKTTVRIPLSLPNPSLRKKKISGEKRLLD